jgi:hypothetical protein
MITFLIVILVAIAVVSALDWINGYLDWFMRVMLGFFVGSILCAAIWAFTPTEENYELVETTQLHNLYDDSSVQGGFFLGSGTLDEAEYYFYNTVTERGLSPQKILKYHNDVYVVEDGDSNPRLEKYCSFSVGYPWWTLGFDCYKVFHIPVGSVDGSYTVR